MRRLALVPVLLIVLSLLLAPTGSAEIVPVTNASFEGEIAADGSPAGWPEPFGSVVFGENVAVSTEQAADGDHSVRIEDTSSEESVGLRSEHIPAQAGWTYAASVDVFVESGAAQLYLEFWNEEGERIDKLSTGNSEPGRWVNIKASRRAPEGTTSLTLLLYAHVQNTGVAFYDSVTLEELDPKEANASMTEDGVIAGFAPLTFDLSEAPIDLPSLAVLKERIPKEHPRLFTRPETLDELRDKRNREPFAKLIWRNIESEAAIARIGGMPDEPPDARPGGELDITAWREGITIAQDILRRLHALGFAYLITGNESYGNAGKELLLHVATWDPYGTSGRAKNDEVSMRLLYGLSRAYDWLYPILTPEERTRVRQMMRDRGNDVYLAMRRTQFEEDLLNNHLVRSMGFLGEAAIALMGEIPEAEVWFDYVVSLFALKYPPWGGLDGGWSQGVSYWQSYISWVFDFLDAFKIATGVDLYEKPFFKNTPYFKLYAHPPHSRFGAFGDHSDSPPDSGSARVMGHFALVYDNPAFQWYASEISGMGRVPVLPLNNFLGYVRAPESTDALIDPALPEDLPQSRLFADIGWAIMNVDMADWENNVHVKFKSSPYGSFNHSHAEQNSFIIEAYGSPLAISSGYYPWYGSPHHRTWTWESRSKNTILVNGKGQGVQSIEAKGKIVKASFSETYDYVVGDATESYEGRVDRFLRHLWFIKPNLIVTYDQIEAPKPATYDWLLHSLDEMEVDPEADRVRIPAETAEMWVSFVTPDDLEFSLTDKFTVPPEERAANKPNQWHLTAHSESEDGVGRFLTVMIPRPEEAFSQEPPAVQTLEVENGHGAQVVLGDTTYRIAFRDGDGEVRAAGFTTDAAAIASWDGATGEGLMVVGARSVTREGNSVFTSQTPLDATVVWSCADGNAELQIHVASGTERTEPLDVDISSPCQPETVSVNGEPLPADAWRYDGGTVRIESD